MFIMNKKLNTGLIDDYNNPIMTGDTIEWTYKKHGVMITVDGKEKFLACVTGDPMIIKEFKETKKIEYEVRDNVTGYFLDRPTGIGLTFIKEKPLCKVIS